MIKKIGFTVALAFMVLGCSAEKQPLPKTVASQEIEVAPQQKQPQNISVTDAFSMIQNEDVTILDVRNQYETITDGKIANSQLIPVQVLDSYLDRLDNSKTILVYCRTGNRSAVASNILRIRGFNAVNVLGGINSWRANGLPTE